MGAFARIVAIHDRRSWADAIVELEAPGMLPSRVVLVPSEDTAHSLRVDLVERAPRALVGTRFLSPPAAAAAVLDSLGVVFSPGEEKCRPLRVRRLLQARPPMETFRPEAMSTTGWEEAIASSISELEMACIVPDELEAVGTPRARDVALLWRALDAEAAESWTLARVMREATRRLRAQPTAWPFAGQTLAFAPLGIDRAHAELIGAIPKAVLGVLAGRPAREEALVRMARLLGDGARRAVCAVPADERTNELGILSSYLFDAPERLAASSRRRSRGPDGSVALERHAGVDEELDAMVRWVATEVFERGVPLRRIAVVFPTADPYASLVAERLRSLAWPLDARPLYVACGVPAATSASGARLLAIVSALCRHLPADALVELLPRFRVTGDADHLSPGMARKVVRELVTLGGSEARPAGALEWRDRLYRGDRSEHLAAVAAPLEALVGIAEAVIAERPLPEVWAAIRELVATHVFGTDALSDLVQQASGELDSLMVGGVASELRGAEAVQAIERVVQLMRIFEGRFGEASIYVGTITGAAGLEFASVRILGLVEGAFPGIQKEDSILPAGLRDRLPVGAMATAADYAAGRFHAFDRVVRSANERLVLSVPRMSVDASEREPASLFIDVASALGRPDSVSGMPVRVIPDLTDLERDMFRVSRAATAAGIEAQPLTNRCWLHRSAQVGMEIPSAWTSTSVVDPFEVQLRERTMHGALGADPLTVTTFGVEADSLRALSFSAMRDLLACPQRFLLRRMLGFRPRDTPPGGHRIDELEFGSLVHAVVEAFLRAHGTLFGARTESLTHWTAIVDVLAEQHFDAFISNSPLRGEESTQVERSRLRRALSTWIAHDWDDGRTRRFIGVELEFGGDAPLPLATSSGPLFVRGRIDRVDVDGGAALVRDLKTGRARPRTGREIAPSLEIDLQLAIYALVARHLAAAWDVPSEVATAYTYVDPWTSDRERAFRDDAEALIVAGQSWIDVAATILREQSYVRTPAPADCQYCAFRPVCAGTACMPPEDSARAFMELRR